MSGGFRDTFTKDEQKDGLLGYDDTAFYYFASSVLLCVALPWTYNVVKNFLFPGAEVEKDFPKKSRNGNIYRYCQSSEMVEKVDKARREARRCTAGGTGCFILKLCVIGLIWGGLYTVVLQLGQEKEIKKFDPFDILEVTPSAAAPEIKKAYRKLSLIYHPDKNPDDPLAASKFIQITKAYTALTDEVAKKNYEKYGNPDGPQTTKVGIGLPRFLLEKENHLMILCTFFFFLLFVIPMTFICYYQKTKVYAPNGLMIETLQFLGHPTHITESTRVKNCIELLAASAESRSLVSRPSDDNAMKPVVKNTIEHKVGKWKNHPMIHRNSFLIWAHMQRQHHCISPELREDLDTLLKHSMRITQAMIEIACMREWFFTAQAMIDFRRSLVQALDVKPQALLQIPHFTEESMKHCHRGKNAVSSLEAFLHKAAEERKGLGKMEPNQLADIEAFCMHVSDVELKAIIEVEDEGDVVVGDVATVSCQLKRKNLKENEAMGPVHAPLFPEPKFEEWYLFLVEGGQTSQRIITFEKIKDTGHIAEEKLRFQVSRPGKHHLVLHAMCDSYLGIDQKVDILFNALTEEEVKREVFVHPEDEELDLQPTLFQQFMGDVFHEDESEEEEEEEGSGTKRKAKAKPQDRNLGEPKDSKPKDESDDDDEDDDPKTDSKKEAAKAGDSSDSSSDSDSDQ